MIRRKKSVIASVVAAVALLMTLGAVALAQSSAMNQTAPTPSTIIWPVDVAAHNWFIFQGYNHGDHSAAGGNKSQTYGLDLELLNGSSPVGQPVSSPVHGTIVGFDNAYDPDSGICVFVRFIDMGGKTLDVSLCHLTLKQGLVANTELNQGDEIGWIHSDSTGGDHLHFNIRDTNKNPIPFTGADQIRGCGRSDFPSDGSTDQYGKTGKNGSYNISCFGYWMGPTPTGTDAFPIHLYGNSHSRTIQLGYQSSDYVDSNGNKKVVDVVDLWDYQNGKWNWITRQKPDSNQQEFINPPVSITLTGPGYIAVDVHTTDGNWHLAQDGVRALYVIYPDGSIGKPNTVAYHDGSTQPIGTGGGGVVENQGMTTSCSPGDDQVALFTDKGFGGQCVTKDAGVYNTPDEIGLPNDSISSIQFGSRSSVRVYVCRDANITNTCEWIDSDVSDLSTHSVGDNQISSLKVEHGKGITICNSENYSGQCTKLPDGATNLADIGADQCVKSVLYDPSYVGHYHVVLWSGGGKGAGNPVHLDQSTSPLNYCGATRIFAVEIYRKMPPNAIQNSPSNGATLASDTKELDLTYGGGDRFTVHVWNLTNHYDVWQGSLTSTTLHITGLTTGTYNWQVQGANDQGAGLWSDTWTFTIPVSSTSTPVPTQPPTPTPTSPPATLITMTVLLDGIGIAGDATNPNSAENMNPLHPNRTATLFVYNGSSLITTKYITISYVSGVFNGIVTVSGTVTGIAIATPGFLVSPVANVTAGQTNHVTLRERNGDVNRDGFRSQADYDAIVACYGSKVASCQYGYNADINDDGVVDGTDINLWLREA